MMIDAAAALTAPGAEYEVTEEQIDGVPMRMFRGGPKTLGDIYVDSAARFGPREMLVYEDQRYSFAGFFGRAEALRRRIAPRPGMRIAIAMRNRPEWMLAFTAITAGGGSAVLVNSRGTPSDMVAAVTETECALILADAPRARALAEAGCAIPVIDVDQPGFALDDAGPLAVTQTDPGDEATIIFTTGTSGAAKGAMLTHRNLVAALMNVSYSRAVSMMEATRNLPPETLAAMATIQPSVLAPFPMFHVAGVNSDFLTFMRMGGKLVLMNKWDPVRALDLIERERIMSTSGSPAMIWDLVRAYDGRHDLSSLRGLGVGGQALPPTLFADVRRIFPNTGFGCGYGQTELGGPVSAAGLGQLLEKPGCSGRPVPAVEFRIVDEDGEDVPPGSAGEILIRGACVAKGYCNRDAETAESFQNGYVRTGDIGHFDADGALFIVDRKKSILISGGENISLSEIEFAALADDDIVDAAAIGVPDARMGEVPVVAVVLRDGAAFDEAALLDRLGARLAAYKRPARAVALAAVPRNHMGKIDRAALRAAIG